MTRTALLLAALLLGPLGDLGAQTAPETAKQPRVDCAREKDRKACEARRKLCAQSGDPAKCEANAKRRPAHRKK